MKFGNCLISFPRRNYLIGSNKVNLHEMVLMECFRDKLRDDQ